MSIWKMRRSECNKEGRGLNCSARCDFASMGRGRCIEGDGNDYCTLQKVGVVVKEWSNSGLRTRIHKMMRFGL